MKKTLLLFTLCASLFGTFKAKAQDEPYTLTVFDQAIYYGMYEATVTEDIPEGAIRNNNSSYGKKLTSEQLESFGNRLTMTVTLHPLCDNYDRIGKVNLVFVPIGQTSYVYNEVERIEVGRFITPFMDKNVATPNSVPYVFDVDNLTQIFHDETITSQYDLWVELEVFGYQGAAVTEVAGCAGHNDVWAGTLEFSSVNDTDLTVGPNFFKPLISNYELKDYTLDGTDEIGETRKTITFTLDEAYPNAKLYLITSNHGAQEEFIRRTHNVYFDDVLKLQYKPGGVSCVPYRYYNTEPNCIYWLCDGTNNTRPDTNAAWNWNNWCPGNAIPTRVIELGDLAAGEHKFKIDIPAATFEDANGNDNGYFPMSVYLQGYTSVLDTQNFALNTFFIAPNPVNDVAVITTSGQEIKSVAVVNTLGQTVYTGTSDKIDMSSLQSGIYIVKVVFANNATATSKMVKK